MDIRRIILVSINSKSFSGFHLQVDCSKIILNNQRTLCILNELSDETGDDP